MSASIAVGMAAVPANPVQLPARDQQLIAAQACAPLGAGGAEHLQAWVSPKAGQTGVEVRCQPHATSYSVPVARQTSCSGARGRWQCERGQDVLRMTLPDESVLTVIASGLPLQTASEVIREAAGLTIRPFYRPAVRVMRGQCTVSSASTATKKGVESFAIQCGVARIILTKDCWEGRCRYFIPFAENY